MNKFFFSTALALLLSGASAFNLPQTRAPKSFVSNTKLYSEEPTKTPRLASIKKDIVYDEKSGRFFESSPGECMPDDEFCIVDSETGDLVRLTLPEKERIFLDALQVSFFTTCITKEFKLLSRSTIARIDKLRILTSHMCVTLLSAYLKNDSHTTLVVDKCLLMQNLIS